MDDDDGGSSDHQPYIICERCGVSFYEKSNYGQWRCRIHPLPRVLNDKNVSTYACCGLDVITENNYLASPIWMRGCRPADHLMPDHREYTDETLDVIPVLPATARFLRTVPEKACRFLLSPRGGLNRVSLADLDASMDKEDHPYKLGDRDLRPILRALVNSVYANPLFKEDDRTLAADADPAESFVVDHNTVVEFAIICRVAPETDLTPHTRPAPWS